jgi:hypothetical protein
VNNLKLILNQSSFLFLPPSGFSQFRCNAEPVVPKKGIEELEIPLSGFSTDFNTLETILGSD